MLISWWQYILYRSATCDLIECFFNCMRMRRQWWCFRFKFTRHNEMCWNVLFSFREFCSVLNTCDGVSIQWLVRMMIVWFHYSDYFCILLLLQCRLKRPLFANPGQIASIVVTSQKHSNISLPSLYTRNTEYRKNCMVLLAHFLIFKIIYFNVI